MFPKVLFLELNTQILCADIPVFSLSLQPVSLDIAKKWPIFIYFVRRANASKLLCVCGSPQDTACIRCLTIQSQAWLFVAGVRAESSHWECGCVSTSWAGRARTWQENNAAVWTECRLDICGSHCCCTELQKTPLKSTGILFHFVSFFCVCSSHIARLLFHTIDPTLVDFMYRLGLCY